MSVSQPRVRENMTQQNASAQSNRIQSRPTLPELERINTDDDDTAEMLRLINTQDMTKV